MITLLLYFCINIDAWSSFKRFRHLWQPNINRANESLSLDSLKNKLQSINFQTNASSGGREKRRKYIFHRQLSTLHVDIYLFVRD